MSQFGVNVISIGKKDCNPNGCVNKDKQPGLVFEEDEVEAAHTWSSGVDPV